MNKLKFECEVITPMFLSGADTNTPELRPPSFKAAMRFWWRATNGNLDIKCLKEKEAKIFGGSGEKEGKSKILINIENLELKTSIDPLPSRKVQCLHKVGTSVSILDYLTFGPCSYDRNLSQNVYNRKYINTGSKFNLIIRYNDDKELIKKEVIIFLIYLISSVGGVGAKSRNGFGRFHINKIFDGDKESKDYIINTKNLIEDISKIKNDRADYTAFSKDTTIFKLKNQNDLQESWEKSLQELGAIYKECRERLEDKHQFGKRKYISRPIIVKNNNDSFLKKRHSKTYFLTIIKEENKFFGYIFFLPYKFLEKSEYSLNNNFQTIKKEYEDANNEFKELLRDKMEVI